MYVYSFSSKEVEGDQYNWKLKGNVMHGVYLSELELHLSQLLILQSLRNMIIFIKWVTVLNKCK